MQLPYSTPIIMNDAIFQKFGGILDETLPAVRQAAYLIAEQFVSESLDTFLLPITVTGSYSYHNRVVLDHGYVRQVHAIRFFDISETPYWTISGTANIYASLRNTGEYGIVDLHAVMLNCSHCLTVMGQYPYKLEIAYTAGLATGSASQPNVQMALTMMSKIILNEIIGFGNEAPGDIGVQSYSNQNYRENRVALLRTTFGTSAQAQMIDKLISNLKVRRYVGL